MHCCSFINGVIEASQPAPEDGGYKSLGWTFSLKHQKSCQYAFTSGNKEMVHRYDFKQTFDI